MPFGQDLALAPGVHRATSCARSRALNELELFRCSLYTERCIQLPLILSRRISISNKTPGEILTDVTARGAGYGLPFKGAVDQLSDLEDLVASATGIGELDLHRGHSPIQSVLEEFLGISHEQMHIYMERDGLNLARTCEALGFLPQNLIQTLTNSFKPFIDQGVEKKIITEVESHEWIERVKNEFHDRVYWNGQ